jgi:TP901 family phage tail tape measure protein
MANFSLGDAVLSTSVDLAGLKHGLDQAEDVAKSGGERAGTMMGSALRAGIVAASGAAIAATGYVVAESVKRASDFEQAMANVGAITLASANDLDRLREAAQLAGSTTKFTAVEAADALGFLGMAGFSAAESIDALPGVLALAAATGTDLATTADIASNILSGFGMETSQTAHLVDVLAATASRANTDVPMLGEAMKYAAPVAAALGISVEDTATAIGKMSDAGIQGSMAGTALRSILTRLAAPTAEAATLMAELGITVFDAEGKMKSLPEIVGEVSRGLHGMDDATRTAAIQTLVGTEAMAGFLSLMTVGEDTLAAFSAGLADAGGTAQEMADRQLATLQGQMTLLGSAIDGVFIQIGNLLLPVLTRLVQTGVIPAVEALGRWIAQMTATGGALDRLGGVVQAVIGVIASMFVGDGTSSVTTWGQAYQAVSSAIQAVMSGLQQIVGAILNIMLHFWQQNGASIMAFAQTTWNQIGQIITTAAQLVQTIVTTVYSAVASFLQNHGDTIVAVLTMAWNNISTVISTALAVIQSVVNSALALLRGDFTTVWREIQNIVTTVISAMQSIISTTLSGIQAIWTSIFGAIQARTSDIWNGIKTAITTSIQGAKAGVETTIQGILAFIDGLAGRALAAGRAFVDNIKAGVLASISRLIDEAKRALKGLANLLPGSEPRDPTSPLRGLAARGAAIMTNMIPGLQAGADDLSDALRAGLSAAADALPPRAGDTYNLTAHYQMQPERTLRDDIRLIQVLRS